MNKILEFVAKHSAAQVARLIGAALVGALIIGLYAWTRPAPEPIIVQTTPKTVTVQVPGPVTTKEVTKFIADPKLAREVTDLLAENKKLKVQVAELSATIAQHTSTGSGTGTSVPVDTVPPDVRPPTTDPKAPVYNFADWRLNFVYNPATNDARYKLTQKFEIVTSTGKNDKGVPVNLVKLFEVGPGETRTEIADTKTTTLVANQNRPRWHAGITLQAGLGYGVDGSKRGALAVGGVQWLKRGLSEAAEDSTLSLLTPVLAHTDSGNELGVLPVSFNLGRVRHQPFKDLWVSPFVGLNSGARTVGHLGIVFTASF